MARPKRRHTLGPPPLVAWSTSKLVVFAVTLPLVGTLMIAAVVASLAIRAGVGTQSVWYERAGAVWQSDDILRSVFVTGWLLVLGLGALGFAWVAFAELRRRRRFPSVEEQQARQAAADEGIRERLERTRESVRTGVLWAVVGVPGLCLCVGYKWLGHDVPGWATFLCLPLAALAPLYWMHAIKHGVILWWQQRAASRWLVYAALGFAAYFVLLVLVVFPFLRR